MSTEELVPTILNAYEPSMAALEDGGHLAVWSSADADRRGIWAQRYDDDGVAVGPIYRINTDETGGQERPEIIRLDDNSLVVVWTDRDTTTLDFEGHTAQRLTSTGALDGVPFQVDTNVAANLGGVDPGTQLSALADNPNDPADVSRFVSVWETYNQDGSLNGIFGQVFNANGKVGTEFQVNTYTTGAQYRAEVKGLADGGFVVLWQSNAGVWGADQSSGIFGQRFDAAGAPVGVEFHVNSTTEDAQEYPQIVAMDDGGFLAVWASGANNTSKSPEDGYYLQRYAADGTTVGEETWIDVELTQIFGASGQLRPVLVKAIELQDGGFALLWENREVGSAHVQSFTADGAALTPAQEVITNNDNPLYIPDLDQLNDGRLILTHGFISGATGDNGIFRTYLDAPPATEFGSKGVVAGTSGNDTIDVTYVDAQANAVSAGDDFILAGAGDDTINAAEGDDVIYGGIGDDLLLGGVGNDTLTGDTGVDSLTGGTGADVFVFKPDTGTDTITDFNAMEGDLIQFYGVSGQSQINLVQVGSDTEIRTTAGDVLVVVESVHLTDFSDFLFG